MRMKYFPDTDTALIEFTDKEPGVTRGGRRNTAIPE